MPEISVVLPAYNEEKNIGPAIAKTDAFLKKKFKTYEIIVVNDGSRDSTESLVRSIMSKNKSIRLVNHKANQGYGTALRSGFSSSKGKLVFYTDSDNQYNIAELKNLLPFIEHYDIVAGFRLHHSDPVNRIFISWVYNQMIRWILGLKIKDVDCSFKLYRKKIFENIQLRCDTGLIDAEVLIKAKKAGFTIFQVGVNHYHRTAGQSIYEIGKRTKYFSFVSPNVPIKIFKEMKKYWQELH